MLDNYAPILVFLVIGILLAIVIVTASRFIAHFTGVNNPSEEKLSAYECGFVEFEDAHFKFDVRFYLVAILFIVFDLEVAFLFPWAVVFAKLGWAAFWAMGLFLGILVVGFIYEWRKGALEWE